MFKIKIVLFLLSSKVYFLFKLSVLKYIIETVSLYLRSTKIFKIIFEKINMQGISRVIMSSTELKIQPTVHL
jgi:hypothetical protein